MAAPGSVTIVYQTSDGTTFDIEADADAHQEELNLRQEFGELFDAVHVEFGLSALVRGNVLNLLVANSDEILSILNGGDFEVDTTVVN